MSTKDEISTKDTEPVEQCPLCGNKFYTSDGTIGASGNLVCESCFTDDY